MANHIFSGRVDEYVRFRLDYPPELATYLDRLLQTNRAKVVADIGSGSGLLSRWLLERGLEVYGIDPNEEMRRAATQILATFPQFHQIAGSAEHTTLQSHSIDLITAGNAFHWFDQKPTKTEWQRILTANGHVLLVRTDWKKFPHERMRLYDQILERYCTKRRGMVNDPALEHAAIKEFFASYTTEIIAQREFDYTYKELIGRFLSTSYAPKEGHPEHLSALRDLTKLFEAHAVNHRFPFGTITTAVYGKL